MPLPRLAPPSRESQLEKATWVISSGRRGGRLASLDPLALICQASWVVQLVLLLLVAFSILSWAVIVFKWRELRARASRIARLSSRSITRAPRGRPTGRGARPRSAARSPAIFLAALRRAAAHREVRRRRRRRALDASRSSSALARSSAGRRAARRSCRLERGLGVPGHDRQLHAVHRPLRHRDRHHQRVRGHRRAGSASLAVVAPGIAEALIATAIGLFAAIPATIFYNVFIGRLRELRPRSTCSPPSSRTICAASAPALPRSAQAG